MNLADFESGTINDFTVDNVDGVTFLKSIVANYLYRPSEFEHVCLYDFLSCYTVSRKNSKSLAWVGTHPSKGSSCC